MTSFHSAELVLKHQESMVVELQKQKSTAASKEPVSVEHIIARFSRNTIGSL